MKQITQHEIRCYCNRQPLLAMYGINESGKVYVHMRVYKNRRIFGEIVVTEGVIQLHCRECLRWFTISFRKDKPHLVESEIPESIAEEATVDHV